jgi:ornithine cyclodeaminase/alanine dehydrogenase-like protein (mu-crystallin family)
MLFLNRAEVAALLDVPALIDALAPAFVELSGGRTSVPLRVAASAPDGLLVAMPGFVGSTLAAKLVSVFPANAGGPLPSHQALIALFDSCTGEPLAVLDGAYITATRTAAASALSTRLLARPDARVLAIVGAGVQARAHAHALGLVRSFGETRVTSRSLDHARALADEIGATAVSDVAEATRGADVVCTCTDAGTPILVCDDVAPGTHVTSVGVGRPKGELERELLEVALLAVESRVAFAPFPSGAVELQGMDERAAVELGELVARQHPGRTSPEQITVYKSMGHAIEDAVAAALVYERALAEGAGVELAL